MWVWEICKSIACLQTVQARQRYRLQYKVSDPDSGLDMPYFVIVISRFNWDGRS